MAKAERSKPGAEMVRINVVLPETERETFDRWCRYGGKPKMSMNARIRQLMRFDAAGKIDVQREKAVRKKKAKTG